MIERCFKLCFRSALHVDSRGTAFYEQGEPVIRSDTLSAAIACQWLQLFPEDEEVLFRSPPYLLSSAFPFYRKQMFLPRPVACSKPAGENPGIQKRLKKAQWLDVPLWQKAANGRDDWVMLKGLRHGGLMTSDAREFPEHTQLWQVESKPRIAVDRGNGGAAEGLIFHFARIHYQSEGGLCFFARLDDQGALSRFEAALRLLGECGIGSDRNSGHGHFAFESCDMPTINSKQAVCLSLFNPDSDDMSEGWLEKAQYLLDRRGGWISGSSWRKADVRMFAEGSCFSRRMRGRMVKVGKHPRYDHPVYRDGRAFMVGGSA